MNGLDLTLLIGAGVFVLLGVYWGIIRQVLAIVGLVVGVGMAGRYGPAVADWLSSFITDPAVAGIIGFAAVLLLVSAVASLIASVLRIFVGLLFLGWMDHLLGGVLGLAQAALAGAALLIGLVAFPSPAWSAAVEGSTLAAGLLRVGGALTALLPAMFESAVRGFLGGG
ncbi:CvpA family protein [Chloroflexales bacterium ZM16-3]|nr:CvpA family protein [Chloroflexales bacterium ZM16-3]